jgi:hypothetical protein
MANTQDEDNVTAQEAVTEETTASQSITENSSDTDESESGGYFQLLK